MLGGPCRATGLRVTAHRNHQVIPLGGLDRAPCEPARSREGATVVAMAIEAPARRAVRPCSCLCPTATDLFQNVGNFYLI
jgi:hypothetical protein